MPTAQQQGKREIYPCPFCGESGKIKCVNEVQDEAYWAVACDNCNAEGPHSGNDDDAVRDWNVRHSNIAESRP